MYIYVYKYIRSERMGTHEWGIVETKVKFCILFRYRYSYRTYIHNIIVRNFFIMILYASVYALTMK
jgi:hypothetical protein